MLTALIDPDQTTQAMMALGTVAVMFALFVRETFPTEVVAIAGVAFLLATGVLPYSDALAVLSNPAPWTIAAMFLVMGALVRTGALAALHHGCTIGGSEKPETCDGGHSGRGDRGLGLHERHACGGGDVAAVVNCPRRWVSRPPSC